MDASGVRLSTYSEVTSNCAKINEVNYAVREGGFLFMSDRLFEQSPVDYIINPIEGMNDQADPLTLDIPDDELWKVIDQRVTGDKQFFDTYYNLTERRKKNEIYLWGRQIDQKEKNKELKIYEARYCDNALYEIESSIKPLLMSRLPDMIVTPGNETQETKLIAEDISKVVNSDLKKRKIRQALAICTRHHPVYFTAVLKAVWNPECNDYEFVVRHPDNIVVDHTATSNDPDMMDTICEFVPMTVQEVLMRFPDKKDEFLERLEKDGLVKKGDESWRAMATEVKIMEVWFTWYKKNGESKTYTREEMLQEPGVKWEKVEGLVWKYKDIIFKKKKNPNYDYEGEEQYYTYDDVSLESSKRQMTAQEMMQSAMTGQMPYGSSVEKIYHNYFDYPKKPYFFFGYDQFGKIAYDETSRIEQNLNNQQNNDEMGKQIIETLRNRGKHIFSKEAGLKKEEIEKLDLNDPNVDLMVDGKVNETHSFIQPERPTPQQYQSLNDARNRMYSISGSSAVRGQLQTSVATSNQIAREADFSRADDLAEDTINACFEWMASWAMQFIKLRYTEEHFKRILGDKGAITYIKISRDSVSDGMEVMIKASGTDKIKAQNNAMQMAQAALIDPLTFFEDMGMSDPKGRAERLLTLQSNPAEYMMKYVKGMTTQDMANALVNAPVQGPQPSQPSQALPQSPSPSNTANMPIEAPLLPQGSIR